jgi:putative Holliday junction resolvase
VTSRGNLLLAFDFGKKRIGVAVGQAVTGTATALRTIHCIGHRPDWDGIAEIIRTWCPETLIVGLPLTLGGDEREMTRAARRFGRQLAGRYGLPVHWIDERLSSVEASRHLRTRGRAGDIDREAARVILQTWLDQRR